MGHELWYALRRIRLRPVHSLVVVLTLGLGLGAALAVFGVVDAVLLRPLPYPEPGRLVRIAHELPVSWLPEMPYSDIGFRRLVRDNHTLSSAAAYAGRDANLIGRGDSRRIQLAQVTASLFATLELRPALGRGFTAEEDLPNGPRALVLSDWLWRSAWNADPGVVGQVANLEGEPYLIVGVLPPWAAFPNRQIAAWEPLRLDPTGARPDNYSYTVIGRLRPGITTDDAAGDLTASIRAVGREYPGPHPGTALDPARAQTRVRFLAGEITGDTAPVVLLLLAGVSLLLLLTSANVVNLQLAAVMARDEELAVRAALGATRSRLVRGALLEGLLLTGAGAGLGLLVAISGSALLVRLLPAAVAVQGTGLNTRLLAVALVAIAVIGSATGALPVLLGARRNAGDALRGRAGGADTRSGAARRLLAGAQVALAVLLLHGSGLLIVSAMRVQEVELGFRPDSTMSMLINSPAQTFLDRTTRETLLRGILEDVGRIPGVTRAGLVNALPLTPSRRDLAMAVEGRPFRADGTDPLADYKVVSAGYFEALGIRLTRGRLFSDDEATARHTPLVISEALVRELWDDDTDPIGQRLRFGPAAPWMPIVGVVADARNRSVTEPARPELYAPGLGTWALNLSFRSEVGLVVRASRDPVSLVAPIRRAVLARGPGLAIYDIASVEDIVRDSRARMIIATRLMSAYAVAALLLAVAGTYAVLSYLVARRRRELAVRMALGAGTREVVALVARESVLLIGAGVAVGLAAAVLSARLLGGLLYGVGALAPGVVLGVVAVAGAAGVGAALLPAIRATRVAPAEALKSGG